ncbi:hypothetical protein AX14_005448 [Amanita brunnescens Koide BX004]|nr:hypothetical protein AX14_005448 [Amanita brunnescens Koide BX004]
MKSPTEGLLLRAQFHLVILGGIYVSLVGLLMVPFFQRHAVYMDVIKLPLFADFDCPEKYGLSPNKTVNLKITTPDNESLGAWFIMSDKYYHSLSSSPLEPQTHIGAALQNNPTILFFHGNGGTRAYGVRVRFYKALTARLGVNVLAVDYRGFAESTGTPSEAGLIQDGKAAFDWLLSNGAKAEDILIVGHSLGTGVSSQLVAKLDAEGLAPRGVVLLAPFSSIRDVLGTYHFVGVLPLIKPMSMIPLVSNFISWALIHKFDTLKIISDIKSPILIAQAEDDWVIPHTHSDVLFEASLAPLLPSIAMPRQPLTLTTEQWSDLARQQEHRSQKRKAIVETSVVPKFGTVSRIRSGRSVKLVKTLVGGHDSVIEQEGLQDIIAKDFELF